MKYSSYALGYSNGPFELKNGSISSENLKGVYYIQSGEIRWTLISIYPDRIDLYHSYKSQLPPLRLRLI